MGETSDRIKQDIERTRAELTYDTDRLVDRANPRHMIDRRTQRMRDKARGLRDRVMGAAPSSDTTENIKRNAGHMADAVKSAPQQAVQQTQGNPLAAGLIVFGAGLLAASLLSESRTEQRAAQKVQERAGGAIGSAKEAVTESAGRVKEGATESAREAGEHLKGSASEAAQSTGEHARHEAKSAAEEMRGS